MLEARVAGAQVSTGHDPPPIQDNSFLVEEAYNQGRGVVQHINTFTRMWNSREWAYTFTQEWPGLRNWRHQFSYTLGGLHAADSKGAGFSDVLLNYRYQLIGDGESGLAFAPRLSVSLPLGNVVQGRGQGASGLQTNLPVSITLGRRLVSHSNVNATFFPRAQGPDRSRAQSAGYGFGQSVVYLLHPRLNLLLEAVANNYQCVSSAGTRWEKVRYLSPGVRWAFNFKNGLQIVQGIGIPFGILHSGDARGVFLYLSFEHPFLRAAAR
jgi:hypothetical protein